MEPQFVWDNIPPGVVFVYPEAARVARQFYELQGDTIIAMRKAVGARIEVWQTNAGSGDDALLCAYFSDCPGAYSMQDGTIPDMLVLASELAQACDSGNKAVVREIMDRTGWYGGDVVEDFGTRSPAM